MSNFDKRILVTGGAGFIGSHLCRLLVNKYPNYLIVNFDALTYAGNLENLLDINDKPNYVFYDGDIRNIEDVVDVFDTFGITDIIHLAAESHVDRSIEKPTIFVETNVFGTLNLLNTAKSYWYDNYKNHRFHQVSTDEVYGSLNLYEDTKFTEETPYNPHSPYSASKASSDHFVKSYHDTYGLNVTVSNCSNNYGPNQFPEKLIPLAINKLENGLKIPIYGKGDNVRDWLYVEDHVKAIDTIFHKGKSGETYNVGGNEEKCNLAIIDTIIQCYNMVKANKDNNYKHLTFDDNIEFVEDRKGHDKRYAIDSTKLQTELGWKPEETFKTGIKKTVKWYVDNKQWLKNIETGEFDILPHVNEGDS